MRWIPNISYLQSLRSYARNNPRWTLVWLGLMTAVWWFVPWVIVLKYGSVTVTRWDRKKGRMEAVVGHREPGWISAQDVSKHIFHAIVGAEDGLFYEHHGFDFAAIQKSIDLNLKKGRYVRGASTISQQVVKMAFLSRDKTIIRKLREALGTAMLELFFSKTEILEWYINLAEFGSGIYGIKDAAKFYFQTRPELLTIEQAIHLALVLPSPNAWSAGLRKRNLTEFGRKRFRRLADTMFLSGYVTRQQRDHALATGDFGRPLFDITPAPEALSLDEEMPEIGTDGSLPSSHEPLLEPDLDFSTDTATGTAQ